MPNRTRPMTALLVFTGLNVVLVSTTAPVYDFVCFHPYWERRRNCEARFTLLSAACKEYYGLSSFFRELCRRKHLWQRITD